MINRILLRDVLFSAADSCPGSKKLGPDQQSLRGVGDVDFVAVRSSSAWLVLHGQHLQLGSTRNRNLVGLLRAAGPVALALPQQAEHRRPAPGRRAERHQVRDPDRLEERRLVRRPAQRAVPHLWRPVTPLLLSWTQLFPV